MECAIQVGKSSCSRTFSFVKGSASSTGKRHIHLRCKFTNEAMSGYIAAIIDLKLRKGETKLEERYRPAPKFTHLFRRLGACLFTSWETSYSIGFWIPLSYDFCHIQFGWSDQRGYRKMSTSVCKAFLVKCVECHQITKGRLPCTQRRESRAIRTICDCEPKNIDVPLASTDTREGLCPDCEERLLNAAIQQPISIPILRTRRAVVNPNVAGAAGGISETRDEREESYRRRRRDWERVRNERMV